MLNLNELYLNSTSHNLHTMVDLWLKLPTASHRGGGLPETGVRTHVLKPLPRSVWCRKTQYISIGASGYLGNQRGCGYGTTTDSLGSVVSLPEKSFRPYDPTVCPLEGGPAGYKFHHNSCLNSTSHNSHTMVDL